MAGRSGSRPGRVGGATAYPLSRAVLLIVLLVVASVVAVVLTMPCASEAAGASATRQAAARVATASEASEASEVPMANARDEERKTSTDGPADGSTHASKPRILGRLSFQDLFTSVDEEAFFNEWHQREVLIDSHRQSEKQAQPSLLSQVTEPLADAHALCTSSSQSLASTKPRAFELKEEGRSTPVESCDHMRRELDRGAGLLVRFESLKSFPAEKNVRQLMELVHETFGTDSTLHLYHATRPDSRALMPHTDPYDVVVIQLQGSKQWTTCVPPADGDELGTGTTSQRQFNTAQLGQLQEIRRQEQQGCTRYEDDDLHAMKCTNFTLHAGDTMYMPKGIIHFALAGEEGSSHLTISLERKGLSWADALVHAAEHSAQVVDAPQFTTLWRHAVQSVVNQDEGVEYLEAMPTWLPFDGGVCAETANQEGTEYKADTPQSELKNNERAAERIGQHGGGPAEAGFRPTRQQEAFISRYTTLCKGLVPSVHTALQDVGDLDALTSGGETLLLAERVCQEATATAVLQEVCKAGRLPVDVTSTNFAPTKRSRRLTNYGTYSCLDKCDESCDLKVCNGCNAAACNICYWTNCDDGCDDNCRCNKGHQGTDKSCYECADNYYQDTPGSTTCKRCGDCPNNQYRPTCSRGSEAGTCSPCPSCEEGKYRYGCYQGEEGHCRPCYGCGPGKYRYGCGGNEDGWCVNCPVCTQEGQYRKDCFGTSSGTCEWCETCYRGKQRVGCGGQNEGECEACPEGKYKYYTSRQPCVDCAACSPGYERINCRGYWYGSCQGIMCKAAPTISHASVSASNGRRYPSKARYTCDTGYQLQNAKRKQLSCRTDGTWGGTRPKCIGVPCPTLNINHGSVSPAGVVRYPQQATISCDVGYVLQGVSTAMCGSDGSWSFDQAPTCVPLVCPPISPPANAGVTYSNGRQYPSQATITCNSGFVQVGGDAKHDCSTATGQFEGKQPQCLRPACPSLSAPKHGSGGVAGGTVRYPGSASFACDPGYVLEGTASVQCKATGTWKQAAPTCVPRECEQLTAPTNGAVAYSNNRRYPSTATYTCSRGYELVGEATRSCVAETGAFDGSAPTCVGKLCQELAAPGNGSVMFSSSPARYPALAKFTCRSDFVLLGADRSECGPDTMWSAPPPRCSTTCDGGFQRNRSSCIDIDECATLTALCHRLAECENTQGSYVCRCRPGYTGNGVTTCTDVDECRFARNECHPDAECTNTEGSYTCTCLEGFSGDGRTCVDVDECRAGTDDCSADAECTNTDGSFTCTCLEGFSGDGRTCVDVDECRAGTHNCDPNANCTNVVGTYTCTCGDGFRGDGFTCTDVNECIEGLARCDSNATCINQAGTYGCACNSGYSGDGYTCEDIDECATNTDACHAHADCTNTDGSYTCTCQRGYSGGGITCTDLDECSLGDDDCSADAECTNTDGSYMCACLQGFSGDGRTCVDVDECIAGTHNCDPNANCTNLEATYTCACKQGFLGDGFSCTDIDECAEGLVQCDTNATCVNVPGSFECQCNTGYTGDGFTCVDENECRAGTHRCDTNAMCTNEVGSYTCACKDGFRGDGFSCTDIDECSEGLVQCDTNAQCVNVAGSFECQCNTGYAGNGFACVDVDECSAGSHSCDTNAECTNEVGSYTCACKDGFRGDGFSCTDIDECMEEPALVQATCHANATCSNTRGSFACVCKDGFSGDGTSSCMLVNQQTGGSGASSSAASMTVPVSIVAGIVGILLVLAAIVVVRRRRQQRRHTAAADSLGDSTTKHAGQDSGGDPLFQNPLFRNGGGGVQPKPTHAWEAARYDVREAAEPHLDSEGYQMPVAKNATGCVYAEPSPNEMQPYGNDMQPYGNDMQPYGNDMQPYGNDKAKKQNTSDTSETKEKSGRNRQSAINPVYEMPRYDDVALANGNGRHAPALPPRADSGPQRTMSVEADDDGYGYVGIAGEFEDQASASRTSSLGSSYLQVGPSCDA